MDDSSSASDNQTTGVQPIQYHDLDLDILNLENMETKSRSSSASGTIRTSQLNMEDEGKNKSPDNYDELIEIGDGENCLMETILYSPDGILDEATVEIGLSNLGVTADGNSFAYLNLKVAGYQLLNLDLLVEYSLLQVIDVSYNRLETLAALHQLPNLVEVHAAHNNINRMVDFCPRSLRVLDLSFNEIEEIPDLTPYRHLEKLNLDRNQISKIQGLTNCSRLHELSLSFNQISRIEGLDSLSLRSLDLCYNQLVRVEGIENLLRLQKISLNGNKIRSLRGLEGHEALEYIAIADNEILDITELQYLQELPILHRLELAQNPIQEIVEYRLLVIFELSALTELDNQRVLVEEKVSAQNQLNPSVEIIAARDHRLNTVYQFFQPHAVLNSTLQSPDTPYPMLVLTGPQGSGKKELAMRLVTDFPDFFGYAVGHTTRRPRAGEENGRDYFFVSAEEFEDLHLKGKFVQTVFLQGQLYGLTQEAIEVVACEGLACIVHLELEGVLSLKLTALEPRYVLTMPLDKTAQESHLRQRSPAIPEGHIVDALYRADLYTEYNQKRPGFFDMFINTNDVVGAYFRLRRLVMDYLGLTSMEEGAASAGDSTEVRGIPRESGAEEGDQEPLPSGGGGVSRSGGGPSQRNERSGAFSRTWSKASLPITPPNKMSASQRSRSIIGRGEVEQESIRRRQSAAKDTVSGVRQDFIPPSPRRQPGSAPSAPQPPGLPPPGHTGPLKSRPHRDSSSSEGIPLSRMSWNSKQDYTFRNAEDFPRGGGSSSRSSALHGPRPGNSGNDRVGGGEKQVDFLKNEVDEITGPDLRPEY